MAMTPQSRQHDSPILTLPAGLIHAAIKGHHILVQYYLDRITEMCQLEEVRAGLSGGISHYFGTGALIGDAV